MHKFSMTNPQEKYQKAYSIRYRCYYLMCPHFHKCKASMWSSMQALQRASYPHIVPPQKNIVPSTTRRPNINYSCWGEFVGFVWHRQSSICTLCSTNLWMSICAHIHLNCVMLTKTLSMGPQCIQQCRKSSLGDKVILFPPHRSPWQVL